MTVFGDATATGRAEVRVWVTLPDMSDPLLLECTDARNGYASCDGEIGVGETLDLTRPTGRYLQCNVAGLGKGNYWCQSAYGF